MTPDEVTAYQAISIHAAREGGDTMTARLFCLVTHFNPRRP